MDNLTPHDILPTILSYLPWNELITNARLVSRQWQQAVHVTPVEKLCVLSNDYKIIRRLRKLASIFPRLQRFQTSCYTMNDEMLCAVIEGFTELQHLDLSMPDDGTMNTSRLFLPETINLLCNNLNHLTYLDVSGIANFTADLETLSKLTNLEVLNCKGTVQLTGKLEYLAQSLFNTLHVCDLQGCQHVSGHVRDLAICQELLYLGIGATSVQGTLSDIEKGDYPSLIYIDLIHGGMDGDAETIQLLNGRDLAHVSSAHKIVQRVYKLYKAVPTIRLDLCTFHLSRQSPDHYTKSFNPSGLWTRDPPFKVEIFDIQGRVGWRWTNGKMRGVCDIQWIDPLPELDSAESVQLYQIMAQSMVSVESVYQGLVDPPTEEEHNKLMYEKLILRRRRQRREKESSL